MKKIFFGVYVFNVFVGELDFLKKLVIVFVRLENFFFFGDFIEVLLFIRFIFFMMGFFGILGRYYEVGRVIVILMFDEVRIC